MDKTPYDNTVTTQEIRIATMRDLLAKDLQKQAEYRCPFKVGQRIKDRRGHRFEVTEIASSLYGIGYRMRGHAILKNGEPSKITKRLAIFDKYELIEEGTKCRLKD